MSLMSSSNDEEVVCIDLTVSSTSFLASFNSFWRSRHQLQRSTDHLSSAKNSSSDTPSSCRCFISGCGRSPSNDFMRCPVFLGLAEASSSSVSGSVSMASSMASWASSSVDWGWTFAGTFRISDCSRGRRTGRCFGIHARNV